MFEIYSHNPTAFWFNVIAMMLLIILGAFAIYGIQKKPKTDKDHREYPFDERDCYYPEDENKK